MSLKSAHNVNMLSTTAFEIKVSYTHSQNNVCRIFIILHVNTFWRMSISGGKYGNSP